MDEEHNEQLERLATIGIIEFLESDAGDTEYFLIKRLPENKKELFLVMEVFKEARMDELSFRYEKKFKKNVIRAWWD